MTPPLSDITPQTSGATRPKSNGQGKIQAYDLPAAAVW